jgi:hypothetical protein
MQARYPLPTFRIHRYDTLRHASLHAGTASQLPQQPRLGQLPIVHHGLRGNFQHFSGSGGSSERSRPLYNLFTLHKNFMYTVE